MRRADRLFQIVQLLRGRRMTTARKLAERLEVSERTIYRDIADLQASGVPIEGEAGVGYCLRAGFDLPPLMFSTAEIEALATGARMAQAFGGAAMARAATEALVKIESVLPAALARRIGETRIYAPGLKMSEATRADFDTLSAAIAARSVTAFAYEALGGTRSERKVHPLGLFFWAPFWTLTAWCLTRNDFRTFRLDRISRIAVSDVTFRPEPGRTLRDFFTRTIGRAEL